MAKSYSPQTFEGKWQAHWERFKLFSAKEDVDKKKCYVLAMFPYPSFTGMHLGNYLNYVITDIIARYYMSQGYNVLHPMGWDAFGLPAEQFAISTGQHPAVSTRDNINKYRTQMKALGLAIDWSREISTADSTYYKWTQWIFLKFFNSWYNQSKSRAESIETLKGIFSKQGNVDVEACCDENTPVFAAEKWNTLSEKDQEKLLQHYRMAYLADSMVNWCPGLGTVLANSEVKNGLSERGGHPVVYKKMKQWTLRITAYANRLLKGLDSLDWPKPIKRMQTHWIGKSVGLTIKFKLEDTQDYIDIFTTRPDTIFGATYLVLSPYHPAINKLYALQDNLIKTTNPLGIKKDLQPITSHQHDIASTFRAFKNNLKDYINNSMQVEQTHQKPATGVFTGLYVQHPLTQKRLPIWVSDYVIASYGTGALMGVPAHDSRDHAFAKHFNLPIIQVIQTQPGHLVKDTPYEEQKGTLIHSEFLNGLSIDEAKQLVQQKLQKTNQAKIKINYRLRDAILGRQRFWGEPIPIYYKNGIPYPCKPEDLPIILPQIDDYKPTTSGEPPLARAKNWYTKQGYPIEYAVMPSWAASSFYFLRYMDPHNQQNLVSKSIVDYWKQVTIYVGGAEHVVGHLLYSRFFNMFLHDKGYVPLPEPFKKLLNQGMIQTTSCRVYRIKGTNQFVSHGLKQQYDTTPLYVDIKLVEQGVLNIEKFKKWRKEYSQATFILENGRYICGQQIEKMSKSKHNTVQPDQLITTYSADTLRLYLMFLGPIEQSKIWNTKGIKGLYRFLQKIWSLFHNNQGEIHLTDHQPNAKEYTILHRTTKQVHDAIKRYAFNTAISAMMVAVNQLIALHCTNRHILEKLLCLLAPFAPHISEELWSLAGHKQSIIHAGYPSYNPDYLVENQTTYPIAINGKVRAQLTLSTSATQQQLQNAALQLPNIQKYLQNTPPKKIIIVPKRIINIVSN